MSWHMKLVQGMELLVHIYYTSLDRITYSTVCMHCTVPTAGHGNYFVTHEYLSRTVDTDSS